jgi:hypothetical protein
MGLIAGLVAVGFCGSGIAAESSVFEGRYCDLVQPPADAGAYATPGGFLLVHPRNAEVGPDYSGCRLIWIMQDATFTPLFIRAQYRRGALFRVQRYDGRGGDTATTCALPSRDPTCAGLTHHELLVLDLPTWPRVCSVDPSQQVCDSAPQ